MKKLFFELLQVATGRLACVERAPSPEEWQQLYEWARRQQVLGVAYHGVELLFEYGLRAPQDVSIDWMEEAEQIRAQNESRSATRQAQYYPDTLRSLRQQDGEAQPLLTLQQMYLLWQQQQLNMRLLMDYSYLLAATKGRHETLKAGGVAGVLLGNVGLRRFACGLDWLLHETLGVEPGATGWKPREHEGRFLMGDLFGENSRWQRMLHSMRYLMC